MISSQARAKLLLMVVAIVGFPPRSAHSAEPPAPLVTGLKNPESVAVGPGNRIYVTDIGEFDKDGDGGVFVIDKGKAVPVRQRADDPKGIVALPELALRHRQDRVLQDRRQGQGRRCFAAADAFPTPPLFLNDIAVDRERHALRQRLGRPRRARAAPSTASPRRARSASSPTPRRWPGLHTPNGLRHGRPVAPARRSTSAPASCTASTSPTARREGRRRLRRRRRPGLGHATAGSSSATGRPARSSSSPGPARSRCCWPTGFKSAADICLDPTGKRILVPDMKAGTLTALPDQRPRLARWTRRRCRSRPPSPSPT